MKTKITILLIAVALLLCGCNLLSPDTTSQPTQNQVTADTPTTGNTVPTTLAGDIAVPRSAAEYVDCCVADIIAELEQIGFSNFAEVPVNDLTSATANLEGTSIAVRIDGHDDYVAGQGFDPTAAIVIEYHHLKRIPFPLSAEDAAIIPYAEVAKGLVEAGFSNVVTDELYDLDPAKSQGGFKTELTADGFDHLPVNEAVPFDTKITVAGHYPFEKYAVKLTIDFYSNWFFDKYGVRVTFAEEAPVELEHGEDHSYEQNLAAGSYKLRIESLENAELYKEINVTVSSNMNVTYELRCHSDELELKQIKLEAPDMLATGEAQLTYSSDYFLRKNQSNTIELLTQMGFKNIKAVPVKDLVWGSTSAGMVASVSINGKTTFSHGDRFPDNAAIIVSYHVPEVQFDQEKIVTVVGETVWLPFTVSEGHYLQDLSIRIRNKALIEDLGDSQYRARAAGTTDIGVYYQDACLAQCDVQVDEKQIPITSISLLEDEMTVALGAEFKVKYTFIPMHSNYTQTTVLLSNPILEEIDHKTFYAAQEGDTQLTIMQDDRELGTLMVHVVHVPAEAIVVSPDAFALTLGRNGKLDFDIQPETATNYGVEVQVADPNIAQIDFDARQNRSIQITGKAIGKTTITIKVFDIVVTKEIEIKEVFPETLSVSADVAKVKPGDSGKLAASFTPFDVTTKAVEWTSSDTGIIKVNADGTFQGIKPGKATVTATHKSGMSSSIELEVLPIPVESVTVTSNWGSGKDFYKKDKMTLTAEVLPANATNKAVSWSSSDESVATVTKAGVVKATGAGTAVITATTSNGLTADYEVVVTPSPQRFKITYSISIVSKNHVGNNWSKGFEFNGEKLKSGKIVTITPGESFTLNAWAAENDSSPDYGCLYENLTLTEDMCEDGYKISDTFYVREDRGRYSGNRAEWKATITLKPVD